MFKLPGGSTCLLFAILKRLLYLQAKKTIFLLPNKVIWPLDMVQLLLENHWTRKHPSKPFHSTGCFFSELIPSRADKPLTPIGCFISGAKKKMEPPSHSCVYETLRRKFPICNFLKTPGPFYWHQPNPTHKYHTTPEIQHRPNKNEVWNTKTTSPNLKKLIGPWRRMFFVLPLGV